MKNVNQRRKHEDFCTSMDSQLTIATIKEKESMPFTRDPKIYPYNMKFFICGVCSHKAQGFLALARHFKHDHLRTRKCL